MSKLLSKKNSFLFELMSSFPPTLSGSQRKQSNKCFIFAVGFIVVLLCMCVCEKVYVCVFVREKEGESKANFLDSNFERE